MSLPFERAISNVRRPERENFLAAPSQANEYDQLKGQFLASLNHELRTPLSGVLGMTDLLLETRLDSEQEEYVQTVRECAAQLLETLNSVLDYSALSAGSLRTEESEFALRTLVESIAADFLPSAQLKGLKITIDWAKGLPDTFVGDERCLRQILQHLVRNSVKFTTRGQIEIKVRLEPGADQPANVRFEVSDTGIGIPPEKLKMIFESFRQLDSGLARNYAGLGLGLALTEKLVRLMRGEIRVSSKPGAGSVFVVKIPLRLPHHPIASIPLPSDSGRVAAGLPTRPARILVVDDSRIAQQVVGHVLGRANYQIGYASSGEAAVGAASTSRYDLILMDLQMPGIDGIAATKLIRDIPGYDRTPILALTANYSDEHRILCQQLGMQGFLGKPIEKEQLLAAVRQSLAN